MLKKEFAEFVGLSPRRVSQLIARGLPVEPSGRIDEKRGVRWIGDNIHHRRGGNRSSAARHAGRSVSSELAALNPGMAMASRLAGAIPGIAALYAVNLGMEPRDAYALFELAKGAFADQAADIARDLGLPFDPAAPIWGTNPCYEPVWPKIAKQAGGRFDRAAWDAHVNVIAAKYAAE